MKRQKAIQISNSQLSQAQARARVNRFLLSQAGSQFCASDPEPDMLLEIWRIPILLVTPGFVVGQVGEAEVNMSTGEIDSHTAIEQLQASAEKLRKRHHAAIEAAFIRAGKR